MVLMLFVLLSQALGNTRAEECDVRMWFLKLTSEGFFNRDLTGDQIVVKKMIDDLVLASKKDPKARKIDCDTLDMYRDMLVPESEDNIVESETFVKTDEELTEISDEQTDINKEADEETEIVDEVQSIQTEDFSNDVRIPADETKEKIEDVEVLISETEIKLDDKDENIQNLGNNTELTALAEVDLDEKVTHHINETQEYDDSLKEHSKIKDDEAVEKIKVISTEVVPELTAEFSKTDRTSEVVQTFNALIAAYTSSKAFCVSDERKYEEGIRSSKLTPSKMDSYSKKTQTKQTKIRKDYRHRKCHLNEYHIPYVNEIKYCMKKDTPRTDIRKEQKSANSMISFLDLNSCHNNFNVIFVCSPTNYLMHITKDHMSRDDKAQSHYHHISSNETETNLKENETRENHESLTIKTTETEVLTDAESSGEDPRSIKVSLEEESKRKLTTENPNVAVSSDDSSEVTRADNQQSHVNQPASGQISKESISEKQKENDDQNEDKKKAEAEPHPSKVSDSDVLGEVNMSAENKHNLKVQKENTKDTNQRKINTETREKIGQVKRAESKEQLNTDDRKSLTSEKKNIENKILETESKGDIHTLEITADKNKEQEQSDLQNSPEIPQRSGTNDKYNRPNKEQEIPLEVNSAQTNEQLWPSEKTNSEVKEQHHTIEPKGTTNKKYIHTSKQGGENREKSNNEETNDQNDSLETSNINERHILETQDIEIIEQRDTPEAKHNIDREQSHTLETKTNENLKVLDSSETPDRKENSNIQNPSEKIQQYDAIDKHNMKSKEENQSSDVNSIRTNEQLKPLETGNSEIKENHETTESKDIPNKEQMDEPKTGGIKNTEKTHNNETKVHNDSSETNEGKILEQRHVMKTEATEKLDKHIAEGLPRVKKQIHDSENVGRHKTLASSNAEITDEPKHFKSKEQTDALETLNNDTGEHANNNEIIDQHDTSESTELPISEPRDIERNLDTSELENTKPQENINSKENENKLDTTRDKDVINTKEDHGKPKIENTLDKTENELKLDSIENINTSNNRIYTIKKSNAEVEEIESLEPNTKDNPETENNKGLGLDTRVRRSDTQETQILLEKSAIRQSQTQHFDNKEKTDSVTVGEINKASSAAANNVGPGINTDSNTGSSSDETNYIENRYTQEHSIQQDSGDTAANNPGYQDRHAFEDYITAKTDEYSSKIQTLELMVMKLENQILLERLNKQNHSSTITNMEKHILQLENDLLRLNMSYNQLKTEHNLQMKNNRRYLELGSQSQTSSSYMFPGIDNRRQSTALMSEYQTKIAHLSQMLRNQSQIVDRLKSKSDYLEDQNKLLFQMVMNQTVLMSQIMSRVQALTEQNQQQRAEAQHLKQQIQMTARTQVREDDENDQMPGYLSQLVSDGRFDQSKQGDLSQQFGDRESHPLVHNVLVANVKGFGQHVEIWCKETKAFCYLGTLFITNCKPYSNMIWVMCQDNYFTMKREENYHHNAPLNNQRRSFKESDQKAKPVSYTEDNIPSTKETFLDSGYSFDKEENTIINGQLQEPESSQQSLKSATDVKESTEGIMEQPNTINEVETKKVNSPTEQGEQGHAENIPNNENTNASQKTINNDKTSAQQTKSQMENKDMPSDKLSSDSVTKTDQTITSKAIDTTNDELGKSVSAHENPEAKVQSNAERSKSAEGAQVVNKHMEGSTMDTAEGNDVQNDKRLKEQETKQPAKGNEQDQKSRGEKKHPTEKSANQETNKQSKEKSEEGKPATKLTAKTTVEPKQKEIKKHPILYTSTSRIEAKDCYDHYRRGSIRNGVFRIKPYGKAGTIQVYCDMKNGGWTVIQKRQDGTTTFLRKWDEYKTGFGGTYGEHWLGNDNIHYLTNQDHYNLRIDLMDWKKTSKVANYEYFMVEDEQQGYRLHVGGYSGDAGDGMAKHHQHKFSTIDVDNDKVVKEFGGSCAKRFSGAWWYYKCYMSNLNGKYYRNGEIPEKLFDGITWKPWTGATYSLRRVEMKIRPASAQNTDDI